MVIEIESIKKEGLWAELTDDELAVIAGIIGKQHYDLGETLFKAAEQDRSLHLIRSGEVKVCMAAPDGELFTLIILKEGDMFGGMSFVDGTPRSATAIAIADVDTYRIDWSDFQTVVDTHPLTAFKVACGIVASAHDVVRSMNARYVEMINYMWGRKRFT